jgi:RND family efflux transporter MFP subunit
MRLSLSTVLFAGLLLSGCGSEIRTQAAGNATAPAIRVTTAPVEMQDWGGKSEATGTVRARTAAVLSSRVSGYVREVAVRVGEHVREGQRLIELDAKELDVAVRRAEAAEAEVRSSIPEAESGVAAAKANLDMAQTTFRRMESLAAQRSISNQELDEASARLKSAQAGYEMARARRVQLDSRMAQMEQEIRGARIQRGYTAILAPFAGIVTERRIEPGSLATPGAPLLTVERDNGLRLEAPVDESHAGPVKLGESVEVAIDALDRRVSGRVTEIEPSVDAASRAYVVKIELPALTNLRSGMFGRAWFRGATQQAVTVPAAALVSRGQLQTVFVVENGVARDRLITLGERSAGRVAVLSGLHAGETVVSPPPVGLADGARVEVRQ